MYQGLVTTNLYKNYSFRVIGTQHRYIYFALPMYAVTCGYPSASKAELTAFAKLLGFTQTDHSF